MQYDFTLPAYGGQIINTVGRFVKYVRGTGQIRVRLDRGGYVDLLPGQGIRGQEFSQLVVEDRSGSGNIGTLLAGAFEFQDDRVTGDVSIIDGGKNRTLANQCFMAACSVTPSAGIMQVLEIWNPAGSGKNLVIEQIQMSSLSGSILFFGWHSVRRGVGSAGGQTKLSNGPLSSSLVEGIGNISTYPGDFRTLAALNVQANQTASVLVKEPIVIKPNYGFYLVNTTQGASLQAWVEYFEEAI